MPHPNEFLFRCYRFASFFVLFFFPLFDTEPCEWCSCHFPKMRQRSLLGCVCVCVRTQNPFILYLILSQKKLWRPLRRTNFLTHWLEADCVSCARLLIVAMKSTIAHAIRTQYTSSLTRKNKNKRRKYHEKSRENTLKQKRMTLAMNLFLFGSLFRLLIRLSTINEIKKQKKNQNIFI